MANKKISQLPSAVLLTGSEQIAIVQPTDDPKDNAKVTLYQIVEFVGDNLPPAGIQSVTGTGVDNTDPDNPVINITKTTIGLSNVDNTSDVDKPVSLLQQAAIDAAVNSIGNSDLGSIL